MFDAATLGFAIDLAHKAGRDRRDLDTTEVARIVETAKDLAKGGMIAQAIGDRIEAIAGQVAQPKRVRQQLSYVVGNKHVTHALSVFRYLRGNGPSAGDRIARDLGFQGDPAFASIIPCAFHGANARHIPDGTAAW